MRRIAYNTPTLRMLATLNEDDRRSVQSLVQDYSIEVTPRQATRIDRFAGFLADGTRVYIPQTPQTQLPDILALATRLRREQMEPVPHLVARRLDRLSRVDDFLARLVGDAGVTQVLVVAGDVAQPAGELHGSLQILESGLLERHGIRAVGVAGHPEGHPALADAILRDALMRKSAYASRTGAHVYIVTQFTFSADALIAWEPAMHAAIGPLPIVVGLPGLATAKTLLKYALECGIGASLQAFARRYSDLTKLMTMSAPDESVVALARYRRHTPETHLAGVHLYTFGGFERTVRWANDVAAGRLELSEESALA